VEVVFVARDESALLHGIRANEHIGNRALLGSARTLAHDVIVPRTMCSQDGIHIACKIEINPGLPKKGILALDIAVKYWSKLDLSDWSNDERVIEL